MIAHLSMVSLLCLEAEHPDPALSCDMHSPGGSVTAGLVIDDTMPSIRPAVSTISIGMVASADALLVTAGLPASIWRCRMPRS
jgi:ATP-dependent Clp protease, protease subunit